jgi:acetyl esterase/lipase
MGDRCAPSLSLPTGTNYEIASVRRLLDQGCAVAVTDYEKLGPPGDHTCFVKDAEAHAVLDIVRAAQRLPDAATGEWGIGPASPVALWGYSQGGQAAAAAAEIEATYAPELDLAGYLNDEGAQLFADGRSLCLFDALPLGIGRHIAELTTSDPLTTPAWQTRLDQQRIGAGGQRPAVPTLLFHGSADQIIPPDQGRALRDAWCAAGAPVTHREYLVNHLAGISIGLTDGIAFLAAALADQPVPSTCPA